MLGPDPSDAQLRSQISQSECKIVSWAVTTWRDPARRVIQCDLQWRAKTDASHPPSVIDELRNTPGITVVSWQPQGTNGGSQQTKPQGLPIPVASQV